MADKRFAAALFYFFILLITFTLARFDNRISTPDVFLIDISRINHLYVNGKELPEEYFPFLKSVNGSRLISSGKEYFSDFDLNSEKADIVSIIYENGVEAAIYVGKTKEQMTKTYIRFKQSDKIYEITGDFLKIIKEKPDSNREYRITSLNNLTSIIAISLEDSEKKIYISENYENIWRDEISGIRLNRLKVQNFINKILNLRAILYSGDAIESSEQLLKIHIEANDGSSEDLIISSFQDDLILIQNSENLEFVLSREKLGIIGLTLEDLK